MQAESEDLKTDVKQFQELLGKHPLLKTLIQEAIRVALPYSEYIGSQKGQAHELADAVVAKLMSFEA